MKADGTQVNTIWASSPGSSAARTHSRRSRPRTPTAPRPGRRYTSCLAPTAPAVILIDEWVAYARSLIVARDDLPGGTFDDQFTFARSLTNPPTTITGA